ncbi:unnamed protein product, partial [Mesorhabditis spiculigera]
MITRNTQAVIRLTRGWLAFNVLQSVGFICSCIADSPALAERTFVNGSVVATRQHACSTLLFLGLRLALLFAPTSILMHRLHIALSSSFTLFILSEVYILKSMTADYANFFSAGFSALSAILSMIYVCLPQTDQADEHRPRRFGPRIYTRHFMEKDVLITPDTPEIRELRKRQYDLMKRVFLLIGTLSALILIMMQTRSERDDGVYAYLRVLPRVGEQASSLFGFLRAALWLGHHALVFSGPMVPEPWDFENMKELDFLRNPIGFEQGRAGKIPKESAVYLHMRSDYLSAENKTNIFPGLQLFNEQELANLHETLDYIYRGFDPTVEMAKTNPVVEECRIKSTKQFKDWDCIMPTGSICHDAMKDLDQWLYAMPTENSMWTPI